MSAGLYMLREKSKQGPNQTHRTGTAKMERSRPSRMRNTGSHGYGGVMPERRSERPLLFVIRGTRSFSSHGRSGMKMENSSMVSGKKATTRTLAIGAPTIRSLIQKTIDG